MLISLSEGQRSPVKKSLQEAARAAQGMRSKRKTREVQCDSRELRVSGGFHLFNKTFHTHKKLAPPDCLFLAAKGMSRDFSQPLP